MGKRKKQKTKVNSFSPVQLFANPWAIAYQAPLSMKFSRQDYWSGLRLPTPGDFPNPGIELACLVLVYIFFTAATPGYPRFVCVPKIFAKC